MDLNTAQCFFFDPSVRNKPQKNVFCTSTAFDLKRQKKRRRKSLKTCPPWLLLAFCSALSLLGRLCSTAFFNLASPRLCIDHMFWPRAAVPSLRYQPDPYGSQWDGHTDGLGGGPAGTDGEMDGSSMAAHHAVASGEVSHLAISRSCRMI